MINEKILLDNGYKKYEHGVFDDCCKYLYQKCIRDENNKRKYWINIYEWDFSFYERRVGEIPFGKTYEAQVQLACKDGNTINIEMLDGWKLEDMEKFFEKMFQTGWFQKYDDVC